MFCTHCGTEAIGDAQFCRSCGRELARGATTPDSLPAHDEPTPEPVPIGAGGRAGPTWSGQPPPPTPSAAWSASANRPQNPADATPELAGVGRRIGAFFIDLGLAMAGLIPVLIVLVIGALIAYGVPEDGERWTADQEETAGLYFWTAWLAVLFIGTWIANATGGSLGKRMLGLRIVRADLSAPGVGVGLGRTLGAWLSWLPVGLGFLWATWDERRQTWHDKMSATYVVRADSLPGRPSPQLGIPPAPGSDRGPDAPR